MALKDLVSNFKISSAEERELLKQGKSSKSFQAIAECMLSGHFLVTDGKTDVIVRPTVLEFYYHEEKEKQDRITDSIVYHRDSKSSTKTLIPTGFLHNHVSGIDLTFEHENEGRVRASVLIREFIIHTTGKEQLQSMRAFNIKVDENDNRSTGMYAALFSQFSIFDEGFHVKWVDGKNPVEVEWLKPRKNVKAYDENEEKIKTTDCTREWKARVKATK